MIAYFILVHRYPEQFKRLFKAIYSQKNYYLVHVDKKSTKKFSQNISSFLADFANVKILKSQNVVWGGYSMVDVELNAMKELLRIDKKWQFFVNLSGQDFPLASQAKIAAFLKKNNQSNFIKIADQKKDRPNTLNRIDNYFLETESGFVGTPVKRGFLAATKPYIGGQWKILTRDCCEFLCTSPKVKKFKSFYKNTLIPDESFFQTVLMNAGYLGKLVNDDKRAIIWVPDLGPKLLSKKFDLNTTNSLIASGEIKLRPKTLTYKDLTFLIKSPALFARKLDESVDSSIFDSLELKLLSQEIIPVQEKKLQVKVKRAVEFKANYLSLKFD